MIPRIKKNAYFLTTMIIFAMSVVFASATFIGLEVVGEINRTSVGFVYLGNKSETQYETILNSEIQTWKRNANYTVYFQEYTLEIDLDYFNFDSQTTLTQMRKNVNNRAFFIINEQSRINLKNDFYNHFSTLVIDSLDFDFFITDMLKDMQLLYVKKEYQLQNYLEEELYNYVIDSATLSQLAPQDVNQIMDKVTTITIPKRSRFSLLKTLAPYQLNNTQLSIISSGMQGVLDLTSMSGFMYEQYRTLPIWANYGMNVRILQVNGYDFTFFNHLDYNLRVVIEQIDGNTLKFSLLGYPFVTEYRSFSNIQIAIPFPTLYMENEAILNDPNVEIVSDTETETVYQLKIQDGVDGFVIFYFREVTELNKDPYTYRIYDEQYLPVDEIYYTYIVYKEVI